MRFRFTGSLFLFFLCGLMVFASAVSTIADVHYVNQNADDWPLGSYLDNCVHTVGEGISAASTGDQVWVAAGTYQERVTVKNGVGLYGGFDGTEGTLAERDWNANETVLDGNGVGYGSVITVPMGVSSSTIIDGFTIQGGTGTWIHLQGSQIPVPHYLDKYCGGGICLLNTSDVSTSSPIIQHNIFRDNTAQLGGSIYGFKTQPVVKNNVFYGNVATQKYDAIGLVGGGHGVYNNTIIRNGNASSAYVAFVSMGANFQNNIVAFNTKPLYVETDYVGPKNNCVYSNGGSANYNIFKTGWNNINVDPLLTDDTTEPYDIHLTSTSPCINAGLNSAVSYGDKDIFGQDRATGGYVDIGAAEYYAP